MKKKIFTDCERITRNTRRAQTSAEAV